MKIVKIEPVPPRTVYAVQTSTKTFIADGLAHHNCYHCNINLSGNSDIYLQFLLKKYGKKTIDRIRKLRYSTSRSWAPDIYKKKISYYKNILKQYE